MNDPATMGSSIDVSEPGVAVFGNKLTLSSIGELAIDLGGLMQGFEYDLLTVLSTAQLGGTLEVQLIDNYLPSVGDTFQVLTATSIVNTFDTIVTLDESDMFDFDVTAIYSATDVVLQIDDVFLSADFDHDDDVDGFDFMILQAGNGLTMEVDNANGDANGDGFVDDADRLIWDSQYGSTFAGLAAAAAASVPEPSTAILLLVGMMGLFFRRDVVVC